MNVYEAIDSRRSVRAFLPDPIPRATLNRLLLAAGTAPSDNNIQPWQVHVVAGKRKEALSKAIIQAVANDPPGTHVSEFQHYPDQWFEPYQTRRRKLGFDLYAKLGIAREDKAGRHAQMLENFRFFGAPIGLFVTIDRRLGIGILVAVGMFLENLMTVARAEGLDTCAQAIFLPYHAIVGRELGFAPEQMLTCGLSLGKADPKAAANHLIVDKLKVDEFVTFHGFEDGSA
jgi:nitroreductase